jgi:hypothetical protein
MSNNLLAQLITFVTAIIACVISRNRPLIDRLLHSTKLDKIGMNKYILFTQNDGLMILLN